VVDQVCLPHVISQLTICICESAVNGNRFEQRSIVLLMCFTLDGPKTFACFGTLDVYIHTNVCSAHVLVDGVLQAFRGAAKKKVDSEHSAATVCTHRHHL
jgi:hypothetical protein